jgi:hypothetical protein
MADELDRNLAQLAAMTAAQLDGSFASTKDRDMMNQNRLDIRRFLPEKYRQHPQQSHHQTPSFPHPPYNVGTMPPPDTGGAFAPIPLPNKPAGLLPMDESAMELVKGPSTNDTSPYNNDASFITPTKGDYPSFQSTTFSNPTTPSVAISPNISSGDAQAKLIDDLLKKVKTLTTKLNAMAKVLDNINNKLNTDSE